MDANRIHKRLKLIQTLIELGDLDSIGEHMERLKKDDKNNIADSITQSITKGDYTSAIKQIGLLNGSLNNLSQYEDPEIVTLKLEISILEKRLVECENEISEHQKLLANFNQLIHVKLGKIIGEIYKLKKDYFAKKASKDGDVDSKKHFQNATKDYEDYLEDEKVQNQIVFFELNEFDLKLLKDLYRKGVTLCHPDKFIDEKLKIAASEIFIKLKEAYERQDLRRVQEILSELENDSLVIDKEEISSKELLLKKRENLRNKIRIKTSELAKYYKSDIIKLMRQNSDLSKYIKQKEEELNLELVIWKNKLTNEQ